MGRGTKQKLQRLLNILLCITLIAEASPLNASSHAHVAQATATQPTHRAQPLKQIPIKKTAVISTNQIQAKLTLPKYQFEDPIDDVVIRPSWNLLSTPRIPPNSDPTTFFTPIAGDYNVVYGYEGCNTADPWRVFDPDAPAINNDLTTITPTIGFWLQATTETTLPLNGNIPTSMTIPLCQGWNLIGMPTEQPRPVRNALFSIDGKYSRVFGYDPVDTTDPWAVYDVTAPDWANDLQTMYPGRGYWILATEATTLTFHNDGKPPIANLISPDENATEITAVPFVTDVIGTAYSDFLWQWVLSYRQQGEADWVQFATGTTPILTDTLAALDPTLLMNGLYEIRLQTFDYQGNFVSAFAHIAIEGKAKIGHFTLSFSDLTVPIAGLPIELFRTYDSRDKQVGDFGVGWRLALSDVQLVKTAPVGDGWESALGNVSENPILPFFDYCLPPTLPHVIAVVFPDDTVYRFAPTISPECQTLIPHTIVDITYEAMEGTNATLEPLDQSSNNLLVVGGNPAPPLDLGDGPLGSFDPVPNQFWNQDIIGLHDPQLFKLTLSDGREFIIDQRNGLQSITDLNGNTLTFNEDSITHSRGIGITFTRDELGRITQITDPLSNTVHYDYDANGDLIHFTNQEVQTTTYTYQDNHYLSTIIEPDGTEVAALDYDDNGRLVQSCNVTNNCTQFIHEIVARRETHIDPTGREITYEYDLFGNVTSFTRGTNQTYQMAYDNNGNLIEMIDPNGAVTKRAYDSGGNLTAMTEPYNPNDPTTIYTHTYTYNSRNQIVSATEPAGAQTFWTYDSDGNLEEMRDGLGNILVQYSYGPGGIITSETDPFGTVIYSDHMVLGEPTTFTDPLGNVTTFTYDNMGNITTMVEDGITSTFQYDRLGRQTFADYGFGLTEQVRYDDTGSQWSAIESPALGNVERDLNQHGVDGWTLPNQAQITHIRDEAGRPLQEINPRGYATTFTYDKVGQVKTATLPNGNKTMMSYDAGGRVTREVDALGNTTHYDYSVAGNYISVTNPLSQTWQFTKTPTSTTVIDPIGRAVTVNRTPYGLPKKVINPDGTSSEATYLYTSDDVVDADNFPTTITNERGNVRRFTYNAFGQLASATDLAGITTTYTYNDDSQTAIGPTGETFTLTYDDLDNLETVVYGDGGVERYEYNFQNLPVTITLPSNTKIVNQYDMAGRLIQQQATNEPTEQYFWNASNIISATLDETGLTHYEYNEVDQLTTMTTGDGSAIHYGRDLLGRVTTITTQISPTAPIYHTVYSYDAASNLIAIQDPLGGITRRGYDDVGRLITQTLPNGIASFYAYSERDFVLSVTHKNASNAVLASVLYERGLLGEPLKITREDNAYILLKYDTAFRLRGEDYYDPSDVLIESIRYGYDEVGNRTTLTNTVGTSTYSYAPGYQLTAVSTSSGNETYAYDANGRLTTMNRDSSILSFNYDSKDQLTTITSTAGTTLTYTYDAAGKRVGASDATTTRQFLVAPTLGNGLNSPHLIADKNSQSTYGYVYAGEHPIMRFGPDGPMYYLPDAQGSTIALADNTGVAVANFQYDGFGNMRSSIGSQAAPPLATGGDFRFHGGWLESATNLYHFRLREYDPRTGRFLSRDAAEPDFFETETLHPYLYANANPHVFRDPTGLFSIGELNVTNAIQNIIASIKHAALHKIKTEAIEAINEAVTEIIVGSLAGVIALYAGASWIEQAGTALQIGRLFENVVVGVMCFLGKGTFDRIIWRESVVNQNTGRIQINGYQCGGNWFWGPRGFKRPDVILNPSSNPAGTRTKSFVTIEIKFRVKTFWNAYFDQRAYNRRQWRAIRKHAHNWQWIPVVMFISLTNSPRGYLGKVKRKVRRTRTILVFVVVK